MFFYFNFCFLLAEFHSNIDIKPPPLRCECGSFNCQILDYKCECGSFKPNTATNFYLLISICVMLPPRSTDQKNSPPSKQRRRSLFGKNHLTETKKSFNEELICWNICSCSIPLSTDSYYGLN